MIKYHLTNRAVEDLSSIWNYTFDEWSESQTDKYYQFLIDTFQEITENPKVGKKYAGIRSDLYRLRVTRHIIFYRIIDKDKIGITRILHERMDLENQIKE
jgi:toxin ParE1/3/4